MNVLPARYESTTSHTRVQPLSLGGFCNHRGSASFETSSNVIGPPIVESRSAASRIARSSATAASAADGFRPLRASNQRRSPGELLLAKYPVLRQDGGSTGTFAQIMGSPSAKPAASIRTLLVFRNGSLCATL